MVRPLEFEEDTVLSSAMLCFWKQGYAATSMRDLERETKLSTGSIYNSFGSKDQLFERVLDFYVTKVIGRRIGKFLESDNPREGILEFFADSMNSSADIREMGCLLVNTAIEMNNHTPVVLEKNLLAQNKVEKALQKAISRAIEAGQMSQKTDPVNLAQNLQMVLSGLLVKIRSDKDTSWHPQTLNFVSSLLV
ncbi:MAG: helix-turn-helix domain-containing protein [Sneathiella sp.]